MAAVPSALSLTPLRIIRNNTVALICLSASMHCKYSPANRLCEERVTKIKSCIPRTESSLIYLYALRFLQRWL
jgi:hypothetical protein